MSHDAEELVASSVERQASLADDFRCMIRAHTEEKEPPNHYSLPSLDRPSEQIRLLYCVPKDETDDYDHCGELHFGVRVVDKDHAPDYHAISYTWGDSESFPCKIYVDEMSLQVTVNCHYALWQACLFFSRKISSIVAEREHIPKGEHSCCPNGGFHVWIDAVCINQRNDHEKGSQVQMMGGIFENAQVALVCIGYHASNSNLYEQTLWGSQRTSGSGEHAVSIANRPYWSRLWIIQEVLLARRKIILCGDNHFSWRCLKADYEHYRPKHWPIKPSRSDVRKHVLLAECYKPQKELLDLGEMLKKYGDLECSDPRDRIYGLLSLVRPKEDYASITVDYTRSNIQLALVAVQHLRDLSGFRALLAALDVSTNHPDILQLVVLATQYLVRSVKDMYTLVAGLGISIANPGLQQELKCRRQSEANVFASTPSASSALIRTALACDLPVGREARLIPIMDDAYGKLYVHGELHMGELSSNQTALAQSVSLPEACEDLMQNVVQPPRPLHGATEKSSSAVSRVGYVCNQARSGDFLIHPEYKDDYGPTDSFEDFWASFEVCRATLIIRPDRGHEMMYHIIGQGVILPGFSLHHSGNSDAREQCYTVKKLTPGRARCGLTRWSRRSRLPLRAVVHLWPR